MNSLIIKAKGSVYLNFPSTSRFHRSSNPLTLFSRRSFKQYSSCTNNKVVVNNTVKQDVYDKSIQSANYSFSEQPKIDNNLNKKHFTPIASRKFESLNILETPVYFPYQPYDVQLDLMTKVIKALDSQEHALLESPTGTGKTVSLLCSTIAWQMKHAGVLKTIHQKKPKGKKDPLKRNLDSSKKSPPLDDKNASSSKNKVLTSLIPLVTKVKQSLKNILKPIEHKTQPNTSNYPIESVLEDFSDSSRISQNNQCLARKPVIYYGTRTQKQVFQVVKELRENTPYLPKIAILGSREHYCIHPSVIKAHDKDERCKKLCKATLERDRESLQEKINKLRNSKSIDDSKISVLKLKENEEGIFKEKHLTHSPIGVTNNSLLKTEDDENMKKYKKNIKKPLDEDENYCKYKSNEYFLAHKMEQPTFLTSIRQNDLQDVSSKFSKDTLSSPIWNMEDLILGGKKVTGCPYFASRILAEDADVIICPYNYILCPSIRRAMNIELEGNIFIFDEAHNIEDAARDASSLDIPETVLRGIHNELKDMKVHIDVSSILEDFVKTLIGFINSDIKPVMSEIEEDKEQRVWHPKSFWKFLANSKVNKNKLHELTEALKDLRDIKRKFDTPENQIFRLKFPIPFISDSAEQTLDDIFETLNSLIRNESAYQIASVKKLIGQNKWSNSLGIWCQDSGLIFSRLTSQARSVILASGTLTPLNTFSSELNSQFDHTLEGLHVIKKNQVWAGVLPVGPNATKLNGAFQNAQSVDYQDELGYSILNIVEKVPNGVLCFFSSYSSMNRLILRWKFTGIWSRLNLIKPVLIEPSKSGPDFENILLNYRALSKNQGAILFGVFRGKFSEGIDFKDDECRCVLSIGIPFPFLRDLNITFKRYFNNKLVKSRGMLCGDDWYKIQGYRAINQALGRCIRHKSDWGAIILLESRFLQLTNKSFLSKWVLNSISSYLNFNEAMISLDQFIYNHSVSNKSHSTSISTLLKISDINKVQSTLTQAQLDAPKNNIRKHNPNLCKLA